MYKHFFKPLFDFLLSGLALIVLSPFFLLFTPIVAIAMKGNPFFVQKRPGKNGEIFSMIKYRTMTSAKDKDGNLLPDEDRLTGFGKLMRKLSIDELPEIFNIFIGDMSIVGPRPQLVRDLVFFDEETMKRQSIRPGLTGWAQVNGRNNVTWEQKFALDNEYLEKEGLFFDIKILFMTVFKVFARKDINTEGMETAEDLGVYLLRTGKIDKEYFGKMQDHALFLIKRKTYNADIIFNIQKTKAVKIEDYSKYSFLMTVYKNTKLEYLKESMASILSQTLPAEQIVIVYDGPIPDDVDTYIGELEREKPKMFTVVKLEQNRGLGLALREGTVYCRNELIARMDDDDYCLPDRAEKQLAFMRENQSVSVVSGNMEEFIGDCGNVVACRKVPQTHDEICEYQKRRSPFNHICVMIKKRELLRAGGYLDWHFNEDSYLWARMFLAGCNFANLADVLCRARVGKDMYARRGGYKYYKSERDLYKFMYKNSMINWIGYMEAKAVRFVVQVLMPNGVRQWFFKTFARS